MRKSFKKNGLIAFTLVSACALTAGAVLAMPNVSASAATANTFEMVEKASVRVTDPAGMRFMVRVSDDVMQTMQGADKAGFLIFPKAYLTADVMQNESYHDKYSEENADYTGLYDYLDVEIKDDTYYKETDETTGDETGYYLANGVVHTVQDANRQLDYAAIAYYQNGTDYSYADFNGDFSRSLFGVLQKAYITDEEDRAKIQAVDAFDWVGSESNPFQIATAEEYTQFVDSISETNTYQDKFVTLTETITLASGFKKMPTTFAGTMSTATDKKLLFDAQNSTYVSFAEDEYATSIAGVDYDCQNAKIPELSVDLIEWTDDNGNSIDSPLSLVDADSTLNGDYMGSKALYWDYPVAIRHAYINVKLDNYDLSNYSYLSVWVAYSSVTAVGTLEYFNSSTLYGSSVKCTVDASGKWIQYKFPIENVLTHYDANEYVKLFRIGSISGSFTPARPSLYIGDITLEKETQLPETTADLILYAHDDTPTATSTKTTVKANDVVANSAELVGEYAVKGNGIYSENGYYINIDLDKYDLTGYTQLKFYLSTNIATDGSAKIGDSTSLITSGSLKSANAGIWTEYTVEIDKVISMWNSEGWLKLLDITKDGTVNDSNGKRAVIYIAGLQFV